MQKLRTKSYLNEKSYNTTVQRLVECNNHWLHVPNTIQISQTIEEQNDKTVIMNVLILWSMDF